MRKVTGKLGKEYFLSIWTSNACNKRCRYCFYEESDLWNLVRQDMSIEVCDAIIERINAGEIGGVSFFGGEPLLRWDLMEYILENAKPVDRAGKAIGRDRNFWNITTNGTLLTPEIIEKLRRHNVHINFSFDGSKYSQDKWRGDTYDELMKKIPLLLSYPRLQVLKTMSEPDHIYEDIKHIKELGFKGVFINQLDAFSHDTYEGYDVEEFKRQYLKILQELHDPPRFSVNDFIRWSTLISEPKATTGCGFTNMGLAVAWDGNLYPCHQGPSLPPEFIIGNIWDGIDKVKEREIRGWAKTSPDCDICDYKLTKCYVSMYNKHGEVGINVDKWYQDFELAKIDVIQKFSGITPKCAYCVEHKTTPLPHKIQNPSPVQIMQKEMEVINPNETAIRSGLQIATLFSDDKLYLMKPFFEGLLALETPNPTDLLFIVNKEDTRTKFTLEQAIRGEAMGIPKIDDKFREVRVIEMPVFLNENFMYRIARGRNIALGIAKKKQSIALFFLDADVIPRPDLLRKLLSVKADMVGALVRCRRVNRDGWFNIYLRRPDGTVATVTEFEDDQQIHVDATGHDAIVIYRQCFDEIYEYKPEVPEAEDMGFCFKQRDKGRTIVIHTGAITKHIDYKDVIIGGRI